MIELPVIRQTTEEDQKAGMSCMSCTFWLRNRHSYGQGACVLCRTAPRYAIETDVCDGYSKETTE